METKDIPTTPVSNWIPMSNKYHLAILGKLGEETGELSSIIYRCIIQGLEEKEPTTAKVNKEALAEEIADVLAMIDETIIRLNLPLEKINERQTRKQKHKSPWFEYLR